MADFCNPQMVISGSTFVPFEEHKNKLRQIKKFPIKLDKCSSLEYRNHLITFLMTPFETVSIICLNG